MRRFGVGWHRELLTSFARTGPIRQVFGAFCAHPARRDVVVVGLGAGLPAAYTEPGDKPAAGGRMRRRCALPDCRERHVRR